MSKFVDEIISDLKRNPETYIDNYGQGVKKGDVEISEYGNSAPLSIVSIRINDKRIPTTYIDNWKLEVAIKNWYKNATIEMLCKR